MTHVRIYIVHVFSFSLLYLGLSLRELSDLGIVGPIWRCIMGPDGHGRVVLAERVKLC